MLHGAAAHARWWDHIAPRYRDMLRPVATDHRGHGDSEWLSEYVFEDLLRDVDGWVEWAKAESGRKPWLMAHSMGGVIALNLFALAPPDVEGLIIVDSPLRTTDAILAELRAFGNRPARPWTSRELFVEKFRLLPASDKVKPETIAHIARHAVKPNGDGAWTVKADRHFHAARPETDQRAGWQRVEDAHPARGGGAFRSTEIRLARLGARESPARRNRRYSGRAPPRLHGRTGSVHLRDARSFWKGRFPARASETHPRRPDDTRFKLSLLRSVEKVLVS